MNGSPKRARDAARTTVRICTAAVLTGAAATGTGCANAGDEAFSAAAIGAVTGFVVGTLVGSAGAEHGACRDQYYDCSPAALPSQCGDYGRPYPYDW